MRCSTRRNAAFQQLVIIDELEALFQRHRMDGNQAHCVFGSGSVARILNAGDRARQWRYKQD